MPTKSSKKITKVEPVQAVITPAWPSLQLDRPVEDLRLHHLMPGQIVTVSQFWPASLCKRYVSFLSGLPLITTPGVPKKGNAVRVNDRFQVDDPAFAEVLWSNTGLKELVMDTESIPHDASGEDKAKQFWGGEVLGLNSNIRIYRYRPGQFFDQHCE
jgi:hypothetical protein